MTNTETCETSEALVDKIRSARWWQGSVIEDGKLRGVEPALPEGFDYWVVASQTCNLYNGDFESISKVEWIAARAVDPCPPLIKAGRHPRQFGAKASGAAGEVWLSCESQERHWGQRKNLANLAPSMAFENIPSKGQSERNKNNFSAWLGRGYTRLELSDELNKALGDGKFMKAVEKLVEKHEPDIFGIFIKAWDDKGTPLQHVKPRCDLQLRVVVSSPEKSEEIDKKLQEIFHGRQKSELGIGAPSRSRIQVLEEDFHIMLDVFALPTIRWNAALIEEHVRFSFKDFLSGTGEDAEI